MRTFRVICPLCQGQQIINVTNEEYTAWKNGALIQDAMPSLTTSEREALMTGTCEECWKEMSSEDN